MSNYFLLSWKHKPELASAFAVIESVPDNELIPSLDGKKVLPFSFELRKVTEAKDGIVTSGDLGVLNEVWLDYQPNNLAWPLMSSRLKSLVEANLTGNEQIDWIECKVKNGSEERVYFVLRFNQILDVLDLQKTMFVQGTDVIIKPVFSQDKVHKYNVFMAATPGYGQLWKITSGLYVSEVLKKAIQKAKLTGTDFGKTSVS